MAPSACMVMTPRCRSCRRARPSRATYGPTCATTGRPSGATRHRPPSTTLQEIDDRNIPSTIFEASRASFRPTPTAAITAFTIPRGYRVQSRRPFIGTMPGVGRHSCQCPTRQEGAGLGHAGLRRKSGQKPCERSTFPCSAPAALWSGHWAPNRLSRKATCPLPISTFAPPAPSQPMSPLTQSHGRCGRGQLQLRAANVRACRSRDAAHGLRELSMPCFGPTGAHTVHAFPGDA